MTVEETKILGGAIKIQKKECNLTFSEIIKLHFGQNVRTLFCILKEKNPRYYEKLPLT